MGGQTKRNVYIYKHRQTLTITRIMRRTLNKALLLIFVLCSVTAMAQTPPKLSIDSATVAMTNPDDTLFYQQGTSDMITYNLRLENVGGSAATGLVDIIFDYNQNGPQNVLSLVIDLESGEFIDTSVTDVVLPPGQDARYGGGGNIIVIWPKAEPDMMASAPDTAQTGIYIDTYVDSQDRIELESRLDLYPNPADQNLNIRYHKLNSVIEHIKVMDLTGRVHLYSEEALKEINLASLPSGLYLIDFKYRDGIQGVFKVTVRH